MVAGIKKTFSELTALQRTVAAGVLVVCITAFISWLTVSTLRASDHPRRLDKIESRNESKDKAWIEIEKHFMRIENRMNENRKLAEMNYWYLERMSDKMFGENYLSPPPNIYHKD
jgi:hypothetical protein